MSGETGKHTLHSFICLACACILHAAPVQAQNYKNPLSEMNRIYVQYPDSIVETFYYRGEKNIPTRDNMVYYWYAANDIKRTRGSFDGKLLHGTYTVFYSNKDLLGKGTFRYGLKKGSWQSWYPRGEIKSREQWSKGVLHGTCMYYSSTGMLLRKRVYKNASGSGCETIYEDGHICSVKHYEGSTLQQEQLYEKNSKGRYVPVKTEKAAKTRAAKKGKINKAEEKVPKQQKAPKTKIKIQHFKQIVPGGQGA